MQAEEPMQTLNEISKTVAELPLANLVALVALAGSGVAAYAIYAILAVTRLMAVREWVRLPTAWINEKRLRELRWEGDGKGSDNSAALIVLSAIAYHGNDDGFARLTYTELCKETRISRSKLSNGLDVVAKLVVIGRAAKGRSTYKLANFDAELSKSNAKFRWGMFPARRLYLAGHSFCIQRVQASKRNRVERLEALFPVCRKARHRQQFGGYQLRQNC
jgi:hypothetical protein